jgi:hypothetical protein
MPRAATVVDAIHAADTELSCMTASDTFDPAPGERLAEGGDRV